MSLSWILTHFAFSFTYRQKANVSNCKQPIAGIILDLVHNHDHTLGHLKHTDGENAACGRKHGRCQQQIEHG